MGELTHAVLTTTLSSSLDPKVFRKHAKSTLKAPLPHMAASSTSQPQLPSGGSENWGLAPADWASCTATFSATLATAESSGVPGPPPQPRSPEASWHQVQSRAWRCPTRGRASPQAAPRPQVAALADARGVGGAEFRPLRAQPRSGAGPRPGGSAAPVSSCAGMGPRVQSSVLAPLRFAFC